MKSMRTGKYIKQLSGDLEYRAFIPNLLPFKIHMDSILQELLSKGDLALGRLDGIAELLPDVDFFILMYVRKEAALSSQIEGTQATFADVLKAEAKIVGVEIHEDVDEIINYIKAMNYGLTRLNSLPLSLRLIREIHKILLSGVRGEQRMPGEFRNSQNWIGGATIATATYVPPPAYELVPLLGNFEKFLHNKLPIPVLIKTGLIHYQFEAIHPFLDGNGRMGRLLITVYLCQQGVLRKPLLYLSEFFKQYRQEYYDRLNAAHGKDEIESWLKFFLEGVALTCQKAVETAQKVISLREMDINKVTAMGRSVESGMKLLYSLYKIPMVKVSDVEKITGLKNPNALALIAKFVKAEILQEITGKKRNRVFAYQNYVKLFE